MLSNNFYNLQLSLGTQSILLIEVYIVESDSFYHGILFFLNLLLIHNK